MTLKQNSSLGIVFILGLLAMLMPLSIDMYLPALPVIAAQYNVPDGSAQMTLSTYILGFALGQLLYGPMADSLGRKPVILGGTLVFAAAAVACALSQTVDMLIVMRFFHGLAAAAASVVINALMRDIYPKDEFSRMMSFVMLVTTIAPLVAPMVGGAVLVWFSWHAIFWILALVALLASLMIGLFVRETLPAERRQPFHLRTTLGNFATLFRHIPQGRRGRLYLCYVIKKQMFYLKILMLCQQSTNWSCAKTCAKMLPKVRNCITPVPIRPARATCMNCAT